MPAFPPLAPPAGRYRFVAEPAPGVARLDAWLAAQPGLVAAGLSRSRLQSLSREGAVTVNDVPASPSRRLRPGDVIIVAVPPAAPAAGLVPQNLPLRIVHEDGDIAVVDKPAGIPVHPGPGHPDGTLVNALLYRCPDLAGVGGELRPGIVHRLDRDTSGLLVVAKNQPAHQRLTEQLKDRRMVKEYLAVTTAALTPPAGAIDAPIGRHPRHRQKMAVVPHGRTARTHYETAENLPGSPALLRIRLETGRTHQIRVHLAHRRSPVLGDAVYGRASPLLLNRHFLHAARLGFRHPATGQWQEHCAPLPPELASALDALRRQ